MVCYIGFACFACQALLDRENHPKLRAGAPVQDDFAPKLSYFFSNGTDLEHTVLGRVARVAILMSQCGGQDC